MAFKTDVRKDREAREAIARLPLPERQKAAERIGFYFYFDGMPLTEDDIRRTICQLREYGAGRDETLAAVTPPENPVDRRIGSLSPAEVTVLMEHEWPVKR